METDRIQSQCRSDCEYDNPDVISGSGFREIVKRINQENSNVIMLYKHSVVLLFISSIMNAILIATIIYNTLKN